MTKFPAMNSVKTPTILTFAAILLTMILLTPAHAQLFTFSNQDRIDYTAQNPFDRLPDGRPNVPAMLRNIAAGPSQLSRLARIAVDAFTARAAMNRVRRSIGPHFGLMDHS